MPADKKPLRLVPGRHAGGGVVHVVRGGDRSPPFGKNTLQFFEEGEKHERTDWEDTVLPPDDESEPHVQSGSFDKVPRQKSTLIGLALFGVCLVAGVVLGARAMFRMGGKVSASGAALSRQPGPRPALPPPERVAQPPVAQPPVAQPPAVPRTPAATIGEQDGPPTTASRASPERDRVNRASQLDKPMHPHRSVRSAGPSPGARSAAARLEQQGKPETTGSLVVPSEMEEMEDRATIAPPAPIAPPPEHPAPVVTDPAAR
jgi:hypothetical protein